MSLISYGPLINLVYVKTSIDKAFFKYGSKRVKWDKNGKKMAKMRQELKKGQASHNCKCEPHTIVSVNNTQLAIAQSTLGLIL